VRPLSPVPSLWKLKKVKKMKNCFNDVGLTETPGNWHTDSMSIFIISSFQEWANAMARRPSSVRPSVCKLLRESLLLADKWPDRYQTCTRWSPGEPASRLCSRSRSKVTWYAHFLGFLEWATPSLTVWLPYLYCFRLCRPTNLSSKYGSNNSVRHNHCVSWVAWLLMRMFVSLD